MERNPHLLIEGCAIACYAIGAKVPTSTSAASSTTCSRCSRPRSTKAYAAGYLGHEHLRQRLRLRRLRAPRRRRLRGGRGDRAHRVARGQARAAALKPPFPAVEGSTSARRRSTTSRRSATCRSSCGRAPSGSPLGPEKNGGPKLYCISGHVKRPGVYEASMHTTLRELIYDEPTPAASGRPALKAHHSRRLVGAAAAAGPARHAGQLRRRAAAGSLLGSAGLIVLDDTVCMVWLAMNLLHFYRHESCGKCTPCREGGDWLYKLLQRVERGEGQA
jgi:NADH-quinone oxidoreductase subunit F